MTTSVIQIKYSTVTSAPDTLLKGELAYSEQSGDLFIGSSTGVPTVIGGKHLVQRVGSLENLVAALQTQLNDTTTDLNDKIVALQNKLETELGQNVSDLQSDIAGILDRLSGKSGTSVTVNDLVVKGNLSVEGTTTQINSEVTTISDPTITLGTGTQGADGFDRGIEMKYYDSATGTIKTGFMGIDHLTGKFKMTSDDGALGDLQVKSVSVVEGMSGNGTSVLSGFIINGGSF